MEDTRSRAAVYGRLSDNDNKRKLSVARQLEDGVLLAGRNGWTVVGQYSDDGISALRGKYRPGYSALMADALGGRIDRIIVYQSSRIWRNRSERADAMEKLGKVGVSIEAVQGPSVDLGTAGGRMLAGLLGEFDTMESEVKSERVARVAEERAVLGKASGHVLFGWRRVHGFDEEGKPNWHDEVDDDAAAIVKVIVADLLDGKSINGVRDRLNADKVPTPHEALKSGTVAAGTGAGLWRSSSVRKLALRQANVARRIHHREDFGPAAWPKIIDEDTHARICAKLADPTRRMSRNGTRTHLLSFSDWASCGVCGSRLRVKQAGNQTHYVCDTTTGCVGRNKAKTDELVAARALAYLADPKNRLEISGQDADLIAALSVVDVLEKRETEAAESFAAGSIDIAMLQKITETLRPQLTAARRAAQPRRIDYEDLLSVTPKRWAETPDVNQRRAWLEAIGTTVKIMPTRRGPTFRPEDVLTTFGPGVE
jgi:site-specific DNA recombinase